jgi:hypothetical protein
LPGGTAGGDLCLIVLGAQVARQPMIGAEDQLGDRVSHASEEQRQGTQQRSTPENECVGRNNESHDQPPP